MEEVNTHGVKAKGFRNADGMLQVVKKDSEVDLGFVGHIVGFNKKILDKALTDSIPVICPMGASDTREAFNINADEVAFF